MLESGSNIINVNDDDALQSMTDTLQKTATDIQALSEEIRILAKSVRQFVVGKKGQEAPLERLTNMMISQVDVLSGSARDLLGSMTRLVDGNTTITVSVTRQSDGLTVTESFIEGIAESANAGGCPS